MISWTAQKVRLISLGSLEKICEELSGMAMQWTIEVSNDKCEITYNNPDDFGNDRPCSFQFPIVGSLGNDEVEKLILLDGLVAHQTESTNYTHYDEESGDPYITTDEDNDWSVCMDPIYHIFDRAIDKKISLNPNLQ